MTRRVAALLSGVFVAVVPAASQAQMRTAAVMPVSLQVTDAGCGVIAFWTGSRRP